MKRMLTLLMVGGAFTAARAQFRNEARGIILGDGNNSTANNGSYSNGRDVILGRDNGNYPIYPGNAPSGNNRQYRIEQVNRVYDAKIQSIRNNDYLSRNEKERAIRQLEYDRRTRILQINDSYKNSGYNGNENCDDNDNHRDNGKHKGWEKNKNKNWN